MKRFSTIFLLIAAICSFSVTTEAQTLPQPSPKAMVMQTVGLTDVTVTYSRPAARGRQVWDSLVPYGQLWRLGANMATTIEVSHDVKIGGQDVKAGKYALFATPGKDEWTFHVNSIWDQGGTSKYDVKNDVATIKVKPAKADRNIESMTFLFTNITSSNADLELLWADVKVVLPIQTMSEQMAIQNIEEAIKKRESELENWWIHARAANYMLEQGNAAKALEYANQSVQIKETWFNTWMKAQALKAMGKNKEAYAAVKRAKELGDKDPNFFYRDRVTIAAENWPKK